MDLSHGLLVVARIQDLLSTHCTDALHVGTTLTILCLLVQGGLACQAFSLIRVWIVPEHDTGAVRYTINS